ncbi:MAG: hypothetical protein M1839_006262 [Geoglossum umbratile]|nr:MAG: hypothetical protein M1839_006262 [Geoglossum umbratile]
MVLAELSANNIARNGNFDVESGYPGTDPSAILGGLPAAPLPYPSMLKTTSEAGDVGPLSFKQSRLPHPVARISPRKYRSTFDLAATTDAAYIPPIPDLGPYIAAQGETAASREMNISTASSIISMYGRDSPSNARTAFRQASDQECRSFSMTQGPLTSASLSNHRSYSSLRDHRVPGTPVRPRSPFTYPTRLKRPGFRPPSPASSDIGGAENRNPAGLDRGSSSRASSPSSPNPRGRVPGGGQDLGRSAPLLLVTLPSLAHPRQRSRGTPSSSRVKTQALASMPSPDYLGAIASGSTTRILGQSVRYSVDKPSIPLYYDYTEAFEDEEFSLNRPTSSFPFLTIDRTIPENSPVTNGSGTEKGKREAIDQDADTGGCGHRSGHSELVGPPSGDIEEPTATRPVATEQHRKESSNNSFRAESFEGSDTGAPLDPRTTSSGVDAKDGLKYQLAPSSNAYPLHSLNRDYSDLDTPMALVSQTQPAICRYRGPEIQGDAGTYTRLNTRRRGHYPSTPRELHGEGAYEQEPADEGQGEKGSNQVFGLESDGATSERPISSYSRRSSIRRFFSSDRGFEDMPEIVTSFEGIGRPYTPDRFLLGDAGLQYSHTKKRLNGPVKSVDSASIDSFDFPHSRSTIDDEDARRSSSKSTQRPHKEREPKIPTVIGDASTINDVPQTHAALREPSRRKRRFSLTAQEDFQVAISGLASANLMKQLPRLPVFQHHESVSFPLPPSATLVGVPCPDAPPDRGEIPAAIGDEGLVLDASGGANGIGVSDGRATSRMSLEIPDSPLSYFPRNGPLEESQGANLVHEMAAPQKFKVRARPSLADHGVLGSFNAPANSQRPSPSPSLTLKASFVAGEITKKVSFQETRQNPLVADPPKFKPRSSGASTSRPYNPALGVSRGEAQSKAFDRNISDKLLSGGCASGGRLYGPETKEMASPGRPSTSSDNNDRGRSNNAGLNPTLRHANPSEPRSVFSDDSSQIATNKNAIKRLTNLRVKLPILSASRRSRDGPGTSDRAITNLTVVRPKKRVRIQNPQRAVGLCEARYKVKKLASRLGSWFHRRRERSGVVFRSFRNSSTASVGRAGVMYPGV